MWQLEGEALCRQGLGVWHAYPQVAGRWACDAPCLSATLPVGLLQRKVSIEQLRLETWQPKPYDGPLKKTIDEVGGICAPLPMCCTQPAEALSSTP